MQIRKYLHRLFLLCSISFVPENQLQAQNNVKQKRIGLGGTPILAYDPDLGLRYGAVINLFDYGRVNRYPNYTQYLNVKAFNSTKGTSNLSVIYETEQLVPTSIVYFEASFINDTQLDFFGFNGIKSIVNQYFINKESTSYINPFYYNHHRRLIRLRTDWHKPLSGKKWKTLLGTGWVKYGISELDFNQFKLPPGSDGQPASEVSLYSRYVEWGLIQEEEKHGGSAFNFLAGIAFDTRNSRINCTEGIWFETYINIFSGTNSKILFGKHILTFRHYTELPRLNSVFTWRVSSQQKIGGTIPFYMLPVYFDTRQNQDGIGGAFTARGVNRNRITANGFVSSNMEWRKGIIRFKLLKLSWEVELSGFADAVFISREYPVNYQYIPDAEIANHFRPAHNQLPVITVGAGTYLIYNKNNITSVNFGWSPDKRFGNTGVYIGSSFLF